MIDMKIEKTIDEYIAVLTNRLLTLPSDEYDKAYYKFHKSIKSLFKEYTMEIINTKVKSFGFDKSSQEMGAEMLRAEQREKLLTITEDKK